MKSNNEKIIQILEDKISWSSDNSLTENEVSKNLAIRELISDIKELDLRTSINIHVPSQITNLNKDKDTTSFGSEEEFIVASDAVYNKITEGGVYDDSPFVEYSLKLLNNYRLFLIDYLEKLKVYVGVVGTEKDNSWNSAIEKIIDKLKYESGIKN